MATCDELFLGKLGVKWRVWSTLLTSTCRSLYLGESSLNLWEPKAKVGSELHLFHPHPQWWLVTLSTCKCFYQLSSKWECHRLIKCVATIIFRFEKSFSIAKGSCGPTILASPPQRLVFKNTFSQVSSQPRAFSRIYNMVCVIPPAIAIQWFKVTNGLDLVMLKLTLFVMECLYIFENKS